MDQIHKWMVCGSKTGQKENLKKKRNKFPLFVVIGFKAKYANQTSLPAFPAPSRIQRDRHRRTELRLAFEPNLSQVDFTLSQATKALRESRGIALLYFRPLHQKGVRGQRYDPAAPYPRERHGTHCTGGWVGLRAGLDWCGKSRPTGIRSLDRPARRQSLYRLRYPAHPNLSKHFKYCEVFNVR